jgi:hypothetical protein
MIFWKQLSPITKSFLQGIFVGGPLVWAFIVSFLLIGDLLFT